MFLKLVLVKKRKRKTFQLPLKSQLTTIGVRSKKKRLKRLKNEMLPFTKWHHKNRLPLNRKTLPICSPIILNPRIKSLPQWSKELPSQAQAFSCRCPKISFLPIPNPKTKLVMCQKCPCHQCRCLNQSKRKNLNQLTLASSQCKKLCKWCSKMARNKLKKNKKHRKKRTWMQTMATMEKSTETRMAMETKMTMAKKEVLAIIKTRCLTPWWWVGLACQTVESIRVC